MKIEELARKRFVAQMVVFGKCDIETCQHQARTVMLFDGEMWQLCKFCFKKLMKARNALQKRAAAEHCMEQTKTGGRVKFSFTNSEIPSAPTAWYCSFCKAPNTSDFEHCQDCGAERTD